MRLCRVEPVILRDTAEVRSVVFHPGGEQLAAACGDGNVKIFDARTGKLIKTLRGHESDVFSVAQSSDGQHLASASADRTVRLWDVATGREVFQRPGHVGDYAGMAYAVAFSPDGRQLVAGGEDGIATIWDATDGREVHRLPEKHEATAVCAAFSPDGLLLATGSWGGVLRIWNAQSGQLLRKIPAHTHRMCAVVFRPDGRWLATAGFDRTIKVWDATTGELLHTLRGHTGVITGLAFSRDGRRLFSSGGEDKTVKVWDPQTEREVLNLRGHTLFCHGLTSSPDGLRLASAGKDGTIRIWDATPVKEDEGLESMTCEHDYEVWSVEFSPDGDYLASAGSYPTSTSLGNLTVRIWDARTCAPLRALNLPPSVWNIFHVAFSPDGKRLAAAAATRDGEAIVNVWETATGREVVDEIRERRGIYLLRDLRSHGAIPRPRRAGTHRAGARRRDRQGSGRRRPAHHADLGHGVQPRRPALGHRKQRRDGQESGPGTQRTSVGNSNQSLRSTSTSTAMAIGWRSARTVGAWRQEATGIPSIFGTRRRESCNTLSAATPATCSPWPSAQTAAGSPPPVRTPR